MLPAGIKCYSVGLVAFQSDQECLVIRVQQLQSWEGWARSPRPRRGTRRLDCPTTAPHTTLGELPEPPQVRRQTNPTPKGPKRVSAVGREAHKVTTSEFHSTGRGSERVDYFEGKKWRRAYWMLYSKISGLPT